MDQRISTLRAWCYAMSNLNTSVYVMLDNNKQVPRPLQLERLLPAIAQMGVGTLVLTNAAKVRADYFGSHLLQK